MIAAVLLAAAASLEPAQDAFARGEYGEAESLALAAAEPPHEGAALYLAALARFRLGRAPDALDLLDKAARAADAPAGPLYHFNRAACLYEAGRFSESLLEYEEAAADPALAAPALINAGFAALDGGEPDRARMLAERARPLASGKSAGLLADLDAHLGDGAAAAYRDGISAFDAGRWSEARDHFRRASALDPNDGKSRVMSGASALHLGARGEARSELEQALSLKLEPADAQIARDYLKTLGNHGWQGTVRLAGGYDSDPYQTGLAEPAQFGPNASTAVASGAVAADAAVGWRFAAGDSATGQLAYGFAQLAYTSAAAADRSLQQHLLDVSLEVPLGDRFRLGFSAGGQLAFMGLSAFSGLQAAAGGGMWASFDETDRLAARLDLSWFHKEGLSGYTYLTGDRGDASLSQAVRFEPVTLTLGYQFRLEDIGVLRQSTHVPVPAGVCAFPCSVTAIEPYGYTSNTVWLSARATLFEKLDLDLSAGLEARDYLADNVLQLTGADGRTGELDRQRRHDDRWFGAASASWWLARRFALSLRYDLVINRSDVDVPVDPRRCGPGNPSCEQPPSPLSYDKHSLTIGTTFSF